MNKQKIILIVVFLILIAGIGFLGHKCFVLQDELKSAKASLQDRQINEQVLDFALFFIEHVLKAEAEVDFETRLLLENKVRNLGDELVLKHWNVFVESKTDEEAQRNVKNLLELLINKIKVN